MHKGRRETDRLWSSIRVVKPVQQQSLEASPAVKHGGVAYELASRLERRTGVETRPLVLGHLQRGGTPTAYDRLLATRLGVAALRAADERRWGQMPALKGSKVELVPLAEAVAGVRALGGDSLALADAILGKDVESVERGAAEDGAPEEVGQASEASR